MPSNFTGFDVVIDLKDGTQAHVPEAEIIVRDVTDADPVTGIGAIELDDIAADINGVVAGGSVDVAVGRTVRFSWFRNLDGRNGSVLRITT